MAFTQSVEKDDKAPTSSSSSFSSPSSSPSSSSPPHTRSIAELVLDPRAYTALMGTSNADDADAVPAAPPPSAVPPDSPMRTDEDGERAGTGLGTGTGTGTSIADLVLDGVTYDAILASSAKKHLSVAGEDGDRDGSSASASSSAQRTHTASSVYEASPVTATAGLDSAKTPPNSPLPAAVGGSGYASLGRMAEMIVDSSDGKTG